MTVAIFGGAGRIGQAIVRRLADRGPVRFTYKNSVDAADRLVAELRGTGRDVTAVKTDVRQADAVSAFLSETPDLSAIISANGAPFPVGPLYEANAEDLRRIAEVDLIGTFHILQSGTRLLAERGGGAIVVLMTAAILRTARWDGMSSIPKAALAAMVRQLARDAGPLNVRANGIAPGVVDTDKLADISALPRYKRELIQDFIDDTAVGRFNSLETIASLAEYLVSDAARDISGQIIAADGGYSA